MAALRISQAMVLEHDVARHLGLVALSCVATLTGASAIAGPMETAAWVPVIEWKAGQPFDRSAWTFEEGFLRNEELQYYTGQSPSNFVETASGLHFIARSERVANADHKKSSANWREARTEARFTSASIVSKQAWDNVKIEIVANIRGGNGAWPAMWLKAPNTRGFGEIDMMEQIGREPDLVHATVHYGESFSGRTAKTADRTITGLQGRDVTYSAVLAPDALDISIDGTPMIVMDRSRTTPGLRSLHQPFNLVINLALGGAWSGPVDDDALPATMIVKSIRIWEWRPAQGIENVTASKD